MYSHRSNFLHAMVVASSDVMGLSSTSCFYAIVPLFHANSWGLVFAAPMTGTRLVLPGQPPHKGCLNSIAMLNVLCNMPPAAIFKTHSRCDSGKSVKACLLHQSVSKLDALVQVSAAQVDGTRTSMNMSLPDNSIQHINNKHTHVHRFQSGQS